MTSFGTTHTHIALIGDPVGHSLSPVMHNALYRHLAHSNVRFASWDYRAVQCRTEEDAVFEIARVKTGVYRGMNVTMPWKGLALKEAVYIDPAADAAGGANVLVRRGYDLYAYNTDGKGAVGAVVREGRVDPQGKRVCVCGTGPTSRAIACAFAEARAKEVTVLSRTLDKAKSVADTLRFTAAPDNVALIYGVDYSQAELVVPQADIFVDATPRGMNQGDAAVVDTDLFHSGQVVLDVVYGHGDTSLLIGARRQGAVALDGVEMLVEQAALSVEIWAEALGMSVKVPRHVMRTVAMGSSWSGMDTGV